VKQLYNFIYSGTHFGEVADT